MCFKAIYEMLDWVRLQAMTRIVCLTDSMSNLAKIQTSMLHADWMSSIGRSNLQCIRWIFCLGHAGVRGNEMSWRGKQLMSLPSPWIRPQSLRCFMNLLIPHVRTPATPPYAWRIKVSLEELVGRRTVRSYFRLLVASATRSKWTQHYWILWDGYFGGGRSNYGNARYAMRPTLHPSKPK